jgi:hypothetical protein
MLANDEDAHANGISSDCSECTRLRIAPEECCYDSMIEPRRTNAHGSICWLSED